MDMLGVTRSSKTLKEVFGSMAVRNHEQGAVACLAST
jgi:hypothetical protein